MKKILVISPKFYSYRETIVDQISKNGHEVHFFDERPSNTTLMKIFLRLKLNALVKNKIKKHYEKILSNISANPYDLILFINVEVLDKKILKQMREIAPNSEFVLYMWDSAKNKPKFPKLVSLFDRAYSFDRVDADKYGSLMFQPLFYNDEFEGEVSNTNVAYDISFVGAGHSDRCKILNEIKKQSTNLDLKLKYYIFFQSKIIYFLQILKGFNIINNLKDECHFKSISFNEINKIYSESNVVIDISHSKQTGLTMRTIESLGLNQKLITTNKNVADYNFFDEKMIYILDRDNLKLPSLDFFSNQHSYDENLRKEYSLSSWLGVVIGSDT